MDESAAGQEPQREPGRADESVSPRRIDWGHWRDVYVLGLAVDADGDPNERSWPTLDEVAVLAGCSDAAVKERSRREGWVRLREEHRLEVEQERRRVLVAEQAQRAASIDRRGLTVADAGLALVGQRLTWLVQRERLLAAQDRGRTVPTGELAALGLAARRWLQVKQAVLGQALDLDDETLVERELALGEREVAARLAEHVARRSSDDADRALPPGP